MLLFNFSEASRIQKGLYSVEKMTAWNGFAVAREKALDGIPAISIVYSEFLFAEWPEGVPALEIPSIFDKNIDTAKSESSYREYCRALPNSP